MAKNIQIILGGNGLPALDRTVCPSGIANKRLTARTVRAWRLAHAISEASQKSSSGVYVPARRHSMTQVRRGCRSTVLN
jgi:hypothetical protein